MKDIKNGNDYNKQFTSEELNNEVWKDVGEYKEYEEYSGMYEVSNLGRVRSVDRYVINSIGIRKLYKGKLCKPKKENNGYFRVALCKSNKRKFALIHRLVAQAFIPNPDNLPEVNHIDENKSNNKVSNLEWCTSKYNMNYGTVAERIAKTQGKTIVMLDLNGNELREFYSGYEAERFLKKPRSQSAINSCCRGERKSAYGYAWKYKK